VRVVGRVQPLLALGAGFHPELTGRQNLYLNCTLMGLDIDQTRARIDRIIEFAEIGDYVDVAIKRYSSGMLARLGFSAAINMSPDVILIDETMAVGDYAFNVKSTAAIRDYIARGTVVLVSHDMSIMERICQRVIWLDHGEIRADGNATSVIYQYTRDQQKRIIPMGDARGGVQPTVDPQQPFAGVDADNVLTRRQRMDENVLVHEVGVLNDAGERASIVTPGDPIQLFAEIEFIRPVPSVRVQIGVYDIDTRALITACDNQLIEALPAYSGRMRFVARFPELVLRPRNFGVRVAVWDPNGLIPMYLWTDISPRFAVEGERRSADLHYVAPQDDLVYSAGMTMRIEPQSQPAEPALSESTEMR
jgi:energy-coupling factor transporter ATP-binding protein EcfA2